LVITGIEVGDDALTIATSRAPKRCAGLLTALLCACSENMAPHDMSNMVPWMADHIGRRHQHRIPSDHVTRKNHGQTAARLKYFQPWASSAPRPSWTQRPMPGRPAVSTRKPFSSTRSWGNTAHAFVSCAVPKLRPPSVLVAIQLPGQMHRCVSNSSQTQTASANDAQVFVGLQSKDREQGLLVGEGHQTGLAWAFDLRRHLGDRPVPVDGRAEFPGMWERHRATHVRELPCCTVSSGHW
jgi:hypothetical protein